MRSIFTTLNFFSSPDGLKTLLPPISAGHVSESLNTCEAGSIEANTNTTPSIVTERDGTLDFICAIESSVFIVCSEKKNNRIRHSIKPGWTSAINKIIWNVSKLPCVWSFKRASCRKIDIICAGKCTVQMCEAEVNVQQIHGEKQVNVHIERFQSSIPHSPSKKRRFVRSHPINQKVLSDLTNRSALSVRIEKADEDMLINDREPPHLPSSNALRITKYRQDETNKGHFCDTASRLLSLMEKYPDCIKAIGLIPFHMFYESPSQTAWYQCEFDHRGAIICIDATGLGLRIPTSGRYIFLYSIVAIGREKSVPVSQMLSQDLTANFIYYWLLNWLKNNKCPREIIMDESPALLSSCVMAFTKQKCLNEYLSACILSLLHDHPSPYAFIRIDRSHFIRSLYRNKFLQKLDFRIRHMYLKIFGFFIQCSDLKEIEMRIRDVFVVCKNKYVTDEVMNSISTLKSLSLDDPIETEDTDHVDTSDIAQNECENNMDFKSTANYNWVMKIHSSVVASTEKEIKQATIDNVYFCPSIEKVLIYQFVRLPLWGNIMMNMFKSKRSTATSSSCEAEFKNIKTVLNLKTRRPDKFVSKHLDSISGMLKLRTAEQRYAMENHELDQLEKSENETEENGYYPEFMFQKENWKNKARKTPPKKAIKSTRSHRSHNSMLNLHSHCMQAPLLPNGSDLRRKGHSFIISNTCAFDSIFSIYAAAYLDFRSISIRMDEHECVLAEFIAKSIKNKGYKFHEARADLLYNIYASNTEYKDAIRGDSNITTLNCFTALGPFFMKLAKSNSIIMSIQHEKTCDTCKDKFSSDLPLIPVSLENVCLQNIERNLSHSYASKRSRCATCDGEHSKEHRLADLIAIDVEPTEPTCEKICDIKDTIVIQNTQFKFYGLIEYVPTKQHFVAHVLRSNKKWQSYDDMCHKVPTNEVKKFANQEKLVFMLFYIKESVYIDKTND